jgi:lysozyme
LNHVQIKQGTQGHFVREVQLQLATRGERLVADGKAGPLTMAAARRVLGRPTLTVLGTEELAELGLVLEYGIDLSGHNEGGRKRPVNFELVKRAGYQYVIVKLTEGRGYVNRESNRQVAECQRLELRVGGYHFADPSAARPLVEADLVADARAELEHYAEVRRIVFADAPPDIADTVDLEAPFQRGWSAARWRAMAGGTDRKRAELAARWLLAWYEEHCGALLPLTGAAYQRPMLYTGLWAWAAYLRNAPPELLDDIRRRFSLWLASYNSGAGPKRVIDGYPFALWQYTGKGQVPGVDGACDINVCVRGAI